MEKSSLFEEYRCFRFLRPQVPHPEEEVRVLRLPGGEDAEVQLERAPREGRSWESPGSLLRVPQGARRDVTLRNLRKALVPAHPRFLPLLRFRLRPENGRHVIGRFL